MGLNVSKKSKSDEAGKPEENRPHCGIIMPISAMLPEYDAAHWVRVKKVIDEAIIEAGFTPRLVSDSDEIGVIHGHIVQNIYSDEIVVCDVSGKNPNVMFELGMRLAFDKPTVIVKDDLTDYSFDTSPIKHIPYRKDQRFDDVEDFKIKIAIAIKASVKAKQDNPEYSPFLRHFSTISARKVDNQELAPMDFILKKLEQIESAVTLQAETRSSPARTLVNEGAFAGHMYAGHTYVGAKSANDFPRAVVRKLLNDKIAAAGGLNQLDLVRDKEMLRESIQMEVRSFKMSEERYLNLFESVWQEVAGVFG